MKKVLGVLLCCALVITFASATLSKNYGGKKVLYIDSYHEGYAWSDGITNGVKKALDGTGAELKIIRMDTKRHSGEDFKKEAAIKAKAEIEAFKPDVVIASDDNASKYLIMPYFKDAKVPFVFCGVNWDATVYGYPYENATGMVEVTPVPQIVDLLKQYAKGERIGFLGPDILTARKEAANYRKVFGFDMVEYYAKDVEDWKKGFVELQGKTDLVIVDSDGGLYKGHEKELKSFVEANIKVPTGAAYDFMAPYALVVFGKVAEEQGVWSAAAALKILDGNAPKSIEIAQNKEGTLIINTRLAKALGVEIPFEILGSASKVIE
jgi:ABC-type uncharacterized transport system substrate-binding protein